MQLPASTRAQNTPANVPTISFHFSGNDALSLMKNGGDVTLNDTFDCCSGLHASLVPAQNLCYLAHGKSGSPLASDSVCCCGKFSLWENCPEGKICKFTIDFYGNPITPCCSVMPDGWNSSFSPDGGLYGSEMTFQLSYPYACSEAIGPTPVNFLLCGFNTSNPMQVLCAGLLLYRRLNGHLPSRPEL